MPEQRFQKLRKTLSLNEFNSVEFLTKKAKELEEADPQLSARILVRVKNLKKQAIVKKQKATNEEQQIKSTVNKSAGAEKKQNQVNNDMSQLSETNKNKSNINDSLLKDKLINREKMTKIIKSHFILYVLLPTFIFAFYQIFIATERYESQAKVIVQQPDSMSTMDSGMALLSGLGVPATGSDAQLVKAYIYSNDMIKYLNVELKLREHYEQSFIDYFSRIHITDSRDQLYKYYQDHVDVIIDEPSRIIIIKTQGFDSEYAQRLAKTIVKRAEWFINSIGHQLAKEQLVFIQGEHELIEKRLAEAQKELLLFQQKYNLLDPTAEGTAMQQITYTLEGQIATKQTELKTLQAIMHKNAPQIKGLVNELNALQAQLENERNKLSQSGQEDIPVSEIMSRFTDYKIKMELALQAYTSSQISLEKSRIEAYRQMKYLITVEEPTLSEDNKYPDVLYNISLFLLLLSLFFGIAKIVITTIRELK